jgi:hypothetical protein
MKLLKPLLALTLLACAVLPCRIATAADEPADQAAITEKLKAMETQWGDAMLQKDHGAAVVSEMLADDFAGVSAKGEMLSKSDLLDEMKKETDTLTASTSDTMHVHVYGPNVATVCGTSTEKGTDKDGKAFTRQYGWVDTWMLHEGKWQCIAEAGMLMPNKK